MQRSDRVRNWTRPQSVCPPLSVCVRERGPQLSILNVKVLLMAHCDALPRVNPLLGFHGNSGTVARGGQRKPDTRKQLGALTLWIAAGWTLRSCLFRGFFNADFARLCSSVMKPLHSSASDVCKVFTPPWLWLVFPLPSGKGFGKILVCAHLYQRLIDPCWLFWKNIIQHHSCMASMFARAPAVHCGFANWFLDVFMPSCINKKLSLSRIYRIKLVQQFYTL